VFNYNEKRLSVFFLRHKNSKFYRSQKARQISDKYEVKEIIEKTLGSGFCIPTQYVFYCIEDVLREKGYPNCVLKPTHMSGEIIFCKGQLSAVDELQLRRWFLSDYYYYGREYNYHNLKKAVIVEPLLVDNQQVLRDYKIFCRNGKAFVVQVDYDRFVKHKRSFYDRTWNRLEINSLYPNDTTEPKPSQLNRMIEIAEVLSTGFPFLRVDLYLYNNQVLVGELTNLPENLGLRLSAKSDYYLYALSEAQIQ
jgi:hypothetical protein